MTFPAGEQICLTQMHAQLLCVCNQILLPTHVTIDRFFADTQMRTKNMFQTELGNCSKEYLGAAWLMDRPLGASFLATNGGCGGCASP